ncbi:UNKNOWN [Stylonychia lemnae]|uniref:Uncharacterized protein n=1 Tax=Stylonychia lemnae TaxID=5949 RepID=A0A078AAP0_STYLE|nr:UNKNOWN [Stylonychia lemnae]|eukprot:CDW79284.1 UNKNOWN [Stylonychia lemnae]
MDLILNEFNQSLANQLHQHLTPSFLCLECSEIACLDCITDHQCFEYSESNEQSSEAKNQQANSQGVRKLSNIPSDNGKLSVVMSENIEKQNELKELLQKQSSIYIKKLAHLFNEWIKVQKKEITKCFYEHIDIDQMVEEFFVQIEQDEEFKDDDYHFLEDQFLKEKSKMLEEVFGKMIDSYLEKMEVAEKFLYNKDDHQLNIQLKLDDLQNTESSEGNEGKRRIKNSEFKKALIEKYRKSLEILNFEENQKIFYISDTEECEAQPVSIIRESDNNLENIQKVKDIIKIDLTLIVSQSINTSPNKSNQKIHRGQSNIGRKNRKSRLVSKKRSQKNQTKSFQQEIKKIKTNSSTQSLQQLKIQIQTQSQIKKNSDDSRPFAYSDKLLLYFKGPSDLMLVDLNVKDRIRREYEIFESKGKISKNKNGFQILQLQVPNNYNGKKENWIVILGSNRQCTRIIQYEQKYDEIYEIGTLQMPQIRSKPLEITQYSAAVYQGNQIIVICPQNTMGDPHKTNFIITLSVGKEGETLMELDAFPPNLEFRTGHSTFIMKDYLFVVFGDRDYFEYIDLTRVDSEFQKLAYESEKSFSNVVVFQDKADENSFYFFGEAKPLQMRRSSCYNPSAKKLHKFTLTWETDDQPDEDGLYRDYPVKVVINEVELSRQLVGNPKFSQRLQNKFYCDKLKKWIFIDEKGQLFTFYPEEARFAWEEYTLPQCQ